MKIALVIIGLIGTLASADQPNNPQRPQQPLPAPVDQFPPDQSFYCPPNVKRCAPPVLPYPGPQVRPVAVGRPFGGVCMAQPAGPNLAVIVLNGMQVLYGPAVWPNVNSVLVHYQRIGVCQPVF